MHTVLHEEATWNYYTLAIGHTKPFSNNAFQKLQVKIHSSVRGSVWSITGLGKLKMQYSCAETKEPLIVSRL